MDTEQRVKKLFEAERLKLNEDRLDGLRLWADLNDYAHTKVPFHTPQMDGDIEILKATGLLAARGWPEYIQAFVKQRGQQQFDAGWRMGIDEAAIQDEGEARKPNLNGLQREAHAYSARLHRKLKPRADWTLTETAEQGQVKIKYKPGVPKELQE